MSKRARLGGRLESWMVADGLAACPACHSLVGDLGLPVAVPRMFRRCVAGVPPDGAGSVAGDQGVYSRRRPKVVRVVQARVTCQAVVFGAW